ncbi:MAG: F0F1 ATP synthase subunit B [Acidimicrobiales bacterium]
MFIATSNFLVPNGTFIIEIIGFVIVLGVIAKVILPPINKALEERQDQIRDSLASADAARAEADDTRAQRQAILDEARAQAREITAQANHTAETIRSEAQGRGQQEYERLVSSAEAEIVLARQRATDEIEGQVASLVLAAAERVIGRELDAERHSDLIDEAVAALRAATPAERT